MSMLMLLNRECSRCLFPALLISGSLLHGPVWAGCPCRGHAAAGNYVDPLWSQPQMHSPGMLQPIPEQYGPVSPSLISPAVPHPVTPGMAPPSPLTTPDVITPPPGTLGKTYQLRSKPVPVDMHPRVALLDVYVPHAMQVFVHDMNPYRTQDRLDGFQDVEDPHMWHFETEPLYPGLPRIYRVEARINGADGPVTEERYVRLIMGRVIELQF